MKKQLIILALFNMLNGHVHFNHRTEPYGTHQPVLYEIATKTTGPIIEFGSGNSSTDLLHEVCRENKRLLVTIDDDLEWLSKFSQKYLGDGYSKDNSGWHKFFYVPGKLNDTNNDHWIKFLNEFELLETTEFDLCFVDQSPWLARSETILKLKDKIKYFILHDCDYFANENILGKTLVHSIARSHTPGVYDFSQTFKYYKVFCPLKPWPGDSGPPTLLASNLVADLPEIDYTKY